MGQVVQLPASKSEDRYSSKLQTQGSEFVSREKKLLDKAEFLEAMILVLNDVRLQNIQSRDFSMMEIVSEEIPQYQTRLEETRMSLNSLRQEYDGQMNQVANQA